MTRVGTQRGIHSWRLLVILALSLLLGIVTTHLVAWHFAWHADDANWSQCSDLLLTPNDPVAHILSWRGQGYAAVRATRGPWNAEAARWFSKNAPSGRALPAWCTLTTELTGDDPIVPWHAQKHYHEQFRSRMWTEYAAGWPWRSHRWIVRDDGSDGAWKDLAWLEKIRPRGADGALTYRVWWPGLLGDTLLYAAPWAVLFLIPYRIRGKVRRHYGHCPRCGYDLQRNLRQGCHECGWRKGESGGDTKTPP